METQRRVSFSAERRIILLFVVLLAGVLPLLVSLGAHLIIGDAKHLQEPLHEGFELAGCCIALSVAMILLLRLRYEKASSHLLWVVAALVAMGIVDGVHSFLPTGVAFSWTRHGATVVGGALFALVWLPLPAVVVRRKQHFILLLAVLAMAGSFAILWWPERLPAPWVAGNYSRLVIATNALGGLGFLAATVFFIRRYLREPQGEDLVFASHTLLFGTASLFFGFSHVWAADWWVWHVARLLAYSIVIVAAYDTVVALYQHIARHAKGLETANAALRVEMAERKRAEADKEKLRIQLVQAQKMEAIGHLAGGIAHDFNNVLAAIVGFASLIKMKMNTDDPLHPNVDQILFATERAATLVRSLLAFSRKQIMDSKPVKINDIVSSFLKLLVRLLGEDITIETIYTARDPLVMADAGQIDQVLINLATNARDAMPKGGHLIITTDVTVIDDHYIREHGYGVPGEYALITVSDTGAGMDKATQEKIFEPFFTTKEVGKGTGLGLSTAYGIVKQHSGFINCYSEPGKGTTFKIYLTLLKSEEKAEIEQARKGDELTPRGSATVLVAEDDADVRKLIVYILEQYGYTVYEAADGEQAVRVFMEHEASIDLLLLDVIMPHKNGREVYREIEKIKPEIKVLFASGYTADIIQKRGILEESFEVILKPVSLTALLQKVREVLDRG